MLNLKILIATASVLQLSSSEDVAASVQATCCSQVFLSSNGELAASNQQSLGIYTDLGQRIANNPHPVYIKHLKQNGRANMDYYLYFRDKDDDLPQGWVVGPELLEDTFYIQTLNNVSPCPVGIFGGYSSNDLSKRDNSFTIDCHSDAVKVSCCPSINISSGSQQGVAGMYERVGDHNGHPWYQGGPSNTSLYYRKAGHGPDGWVVGPDLDNYIITTRDDKAYCPDNVREGFDQDRDKDDGFRMICEVVSDDLDQDPGIPAAPLEILKPNKAISSSAKETLRSSACFRLLVIVYFLIMKLAEDTE